MFPCDEPLNKDQRQTFQSFLHKQPVRKDATSENVLAGHNNNLPRKLLWTRNGWAVAMVTQDQWSQIDGHVATLQVNNVPVVDNRCELWSQRLKRARDTLDVNVMENFYALVVVKDTDLGCVKRSFHGESTSRPGDDQFPHHYRLLMPDALPNRTWQCLIATDAFRLGSLLISVFLFSAGRCLSYCKILA